MTSAIWKMIDRPCRTILAPIFTSRSRYSSVGTAAPDILLCEPLWRAHPVVFRYFDDVGTRDYLAFAAPWLAHALPYRQRVGLALRKPHPQPGYITPAVWDQPGLPEVVLPCRHVFAVRCIMAP
jgi:hypothetical protein